MRRIFLGLSTPVLEPLADGPVANPKFGCAIGHVVATPDALPALEKADQQPGVLARPLAEIVNE